MCLATSGYALTKGAPFVQAYCQDTSAVKWSFQGLGGGYYQVRNHDLPSMCLGVSGASRTAGARAVLWPCNGSSDQSWQFLPTGWSFRLKNRNSGQFLSVSGGSRAVGAPVLQWPANGLSNQIWTRNELVVIG